MTRHSATTAPMINGRNVRWIGVAGLALLLQTAATSAGAANLFATVDQNGALISGSGVSSVSHIFTGQYQVTFTANVSACAFIATTVNAYSQALQAYTASGHMSVNGVYVETKNQGGGLTDGPFNLIVICGIPKTKFAVVGYAADLVRATPGTILTALGSGRYKLTFLESIKPCAYVATVADPGPALVFAPSGVYTGSTAEANSIYIETKNPGGGLQDGVPFHLAVICPGASHMSLGVVNASGLINRASPLTSSFKSATGKYAVVTNTNIRPNCATVATRGSVDKAVPFSPATVELAPGPAPNTIGIEVRQLLLFGGAFLNEAFHSATVCP